MKKVIIDTNLLVYWTAQGIIDLEGSLLGNIKLFESLPSQFKVIPTFVLNEYNIVIQKNFPRHFNLKNSKKHDLLCIRAKEFLYQIDNFAELYYINEIEMKYALHLLNDLLNFNPKSQKLSLTDLCIVAIAKLNNYEILTNDSNIKKFFEQL